MADAGGPVLPRRGFLSDNASGIHPEVLAAISEANVGHSTAYGADPWTAHATALLTEEFGAGSQPFLVFNGTGANVSALAALLRPHHAVLCAADAHLQTDECGAPARFTGSTLIPVPTEDGLLTPDRLEAAVSRPARGEHNVVPAVLTVTNASELGAVYSPRQIADLAEWAHGRGLLVHMDGARLANAAAASGCSLAEAGIASGVDVLSFGGTKNGLLLGEAVVFAGTPAAVAAAREYRYARKQAMQLASKMRFIAAQFVALLTDELWRRNAAAANSAASYLATRLATVPGVTLAHPTRANMVFPVMPAPMARALIARFPFHMWDDAAGIARLVCSFDTETTEIDDLVAHAHSLSDQHEH